MNRSRIVLGGLVAGLLIAFGESVLNALVVQPLLERGAALTRVPDPPLGVVVVRSAILGMLCILLYAAMRPRLGAGPKTAAAAGFVVFLVSVVYPPFGLAMSTFPGAVLLAAIAWSAVELPLATMAGARVYREGESTLHAPAASPYIERMRRLVGREMLMLPSVAVLVFDRSGRVLLALRRATQQWIVPGGPIEPEEDPRDTAVREVRAETGCRVTPGEVLAVLGGRAHRERQPDGSEVARVVVVYGATLDEGDPLPMREDTDEVRFVHLDELATYNAPLWLLDLLDARARGPDDA